MRAKTLHNYNVLARALPQANATVVNGTPRLTPRLYGSYEESQDERDEPLQESNNNVVNQMKTQTHTHINAMYNNV